MFRSFSFLFHKYCVVFQEYYCLLCADMGHPSKVIKNTYKHILASENCSGRKRRVTRNTLKGNYITLTNYNFIAMELVLDRAKETAKQHLSRKPYDKLEILIFTGRSQISAYRIGPHAPINTSRPRGFGGLTLS